MEHIPPITAIASFFLAQLFIALSLAFDDVSEEAKKNPTNVRRRRLAVAGAVVNVVALIASVLMTRPA